MELIAKISKGSKMDQVYLPKNRGGFPIGSHVMIKPLEPQQVQQAQEKPYFYGLKNIESLKLQIVQGIFNIILHTAPACENIFVTGSFLEQGFHFNDIDVLIVSDKTVDKDFLKKKIEMDMQIKIHILVISQEALLRGLATDPLYQMMLSKAIAKKRFIYHVQREIHYKLLDVHLLKSKPLPDNFEFLTGDEKYYLTRNMVAILMFIQHKKLSKEHVDNEVVKLFSLKSIKELQQNMLDKKNFLYKFKEVYQKTFDLILRGVSHESK